MRTQSQVASSVHSVYERLRRFYLLAATVLALTAGTLAATPGAASATVFNYCGVMISQGTWCGNNTQHTYYHNFGYAQTASGRTCERMRNGASGIRGSGPHCGSDGGYSISWCYSNPGQTTQLWLVEVAHTGGGTVNLSGSADYGSAGPNRCPV